MQLYPAALAILVFAFLTIQCSRQEQYENPPGYDLSKPERIPVDHDLREISGIALRPGNDQIVYAIEDEHGRIYRVEPGKPGSSFTKFNSKGDYEDIAIAGDQAYVLRSDGSIYEVPLSETGDETKATRPFEKILPEAEYEGIYAPDSNSLLVLCKKCPGDKEKKEVSAYRIRISADKNLAVESVFKISIADPVIKDETARPKFNPSAIAFNTADQQWYIISSVNKMLLLLDSDFKLHKAFKIDPAIFTQPEGLAFDTKGSLYVSNEGTNGVILRFPFKKQ